MNKYQFFFKRLFDLFFALLLLLLFSWIIVIACLLSSIETRSNGLFFQKRVGQHGKIFFICKIKTMFNTACSSPSSVTVLGGKRITRCGAFFRKYKIDELPQLFNILLGQMSFVGPRPDVPGYADKLIGSDRILLNFKPGLTGPASLYFRDEESLLANQSDPVSYNNKYIWPKKIALNLEYVRNWSLLLDAVIIYKTILSVL